ncbi:VOC family protein [Lysobacter korlensis]|uniref:VOC family protein n=1 Tax=Lysobacter korlensis TaxID=553636 RepID=A0ABV6RWX2_9GAMM
MFTETIAVLPASDLARAKAFYHDAFGFDPVEVRNGDLVYRPRAGIAFEVYETSNAGTAKNTQMCFHTDDLDGDMRQLRDRGIIFEDYDFPGLKTVDGVAEMDGERAAWFRDSEGNYICLGQPKTKSATAGGGAADDVSGVSSAFYD